MGSLLLYIHTPDYSPVKLSTLLPRAENVLPGVKVVQVPRWTFTLQH